MRIISRYIARDIVAAIAAIALVLLLIILGKLFIQLLGEVLEGDLSAASLGTVLLLGVIRYLVILLPFSLYIGTIMVLSRMHKDSEMHAVMAGGANNRTLIEAVMAVGVPILVMVYLLVSYISPWAYRLTEVIENVTEQSMVLGQLPAGKFFEMERSGWVLYAEKEEVETGTLHNVFLQRKDGDKLIVEVARRAKMQQGDGLAQAFVLYDGKTIEGIPGHADYALSTYEEHHIYPPRTDFSREAHKAKYQPIDALLALPDSSYLAELLQRLSIVFSTLLLMLLAIPLSKVEPDSGRFSRLAIAVVIYILYLNLVIVSCGGIKKGEAYGLPALTVTHILAMLVTFLAYQQACPYSWWSRLRQAIPS